MSNVWFRDRVVVVIGASSGIGRAAVQGLVDSGARVAAVARSSDRLESLVGGLASSGRAMAIPADVTRPAEVERVVDDVRSGLGRIDVVLYSAGVEHLGPFDSVSLDELHEMVGANFYGLHHVVRAVLPVMRQQASPAGGVGPKAAGGTIAYVSSPMSRFAFAWSSAYAASKAAADTYLLGLRREVDPGQVRVVTIYPGPTATAAGRHLPEDRLPAWHEHGPKLEPERSAGQVLDAIASGRPISVLARPIRVLMGAQRLVPPLADQLISRVGVAAR